MIVQREFLTKLKIFGLNSYEAKLWTALLSRGVSTAGELSDISNVPRSRSYDVLESLEKKGFVVMKLGKPIKYLAIPPSDVIDRIKKHVQESAEEQTTSLEGLRTSTVLDDLSSLYKNGLTVVDPSDMTGALKGRSNMYNHLYALIKNAQKSVTILTTKEGFSRKMSSFKSVLQKAKDRGAKIRIAAPIDKDNQRMIQEFSNIAKIRHVDDVKGRFCVVDGKHVILMPLDDAKIHPTFDFGIWSSADFLAGTLEQLFDKTWSVAKE